MLNILLNIDVQITQFIASLLPHNQSFNLFFSFFSQQGGSLIIWIVLVILALLFEVRKHPGISKKDKQFILTIILTLAITTLFVNYGLKNIFQRTRPYLIDKPIKLTLTDSTDFNCPIDFSFPSSHAAIAFSASVILVFFHKKRKYFYYLIAIIISLSRIYLGCHYFFDVIVGGLIGWLIAKIILIRLKPHSN